MRIRIYRYCNGAMSQPLLHLFRMHVRLQERVPGILEAQVGKNLRTTIEVILMAL